MTLTGAASGKIEGISLVARRRPVCIFSLNVFGLGLSHPHAAQRESLRV